MIPFGYIHKTNFVGVGECNNPFYKILSGNKVESTLFINGKPFKLPFANHAFIRLPHNKMILDATVSPHLATETLLGYAQNAIDTSANYQHNVLREKFYYKENMNIPPQMLLPDELTQRILTLEVNMRNINITMVTLVKELRMLFGKKINTVTITGVLSLGMMVLMLNSALAVGQQSDARKEGNKMTVDYIEQTSTIEWSKEEYLEKIGDIAKYPTIEAYFKEDARLIEGDQLLGFSKLLLQKPEKKVNQLSLNFKLAEQLPFKSSDDMTYKVAGIINNHYVDNLTKISLFQEIKVMIFKNGEQNQKLSPPFVDISINVFSGKQGHRISQHVFIKHLYGYTFPGFLYIKGPSTLGEISTRDRDFESRGRLFWIYQNVMSQLVNYQVTDDDVIKIAQWVYDNIEFTEVEIKE